MKNFWKSLLGANNISIGNKFRYILGSGPIEISYALFYTYFMVYLTDVAGMSPIAAGILSGVVAFVDGAVDPALGVYSDLKYERDGTRRSLMFKGAIPLSAIAVLLFVPVQFTGAMQVVYYFIVALLFVTMYSLYSINYSSVVGELTSDYSERNTMRLLLSLGTPVYAWLGTGGIQVVMTLMPDSPIKTQWLVVGILLSAIAIILFFLFIPMIKKRERAPALEKMHEKQTGKKAGMGVWRSFKEVLKIKQLIMHAFMTLFFSLGNGFRYALIVYVMTYTARLTSGEQAVYWSATNIANYVILFLSIFLVNLIGSRRIVFVGAFLIAAVSSFYFYFQGLDTLYAVCVFGILFVVIESPFWAMWFSISFDIADLDEFLHSKRRTALISSISMFMVKVGPTISLMATGFLLSSAGYVEGGAEQTIATGEALGNYITLLSGIFFALGAIVFWGYNINKKNSTALNKALEKKRKGEAYSTEGFSEILPRWYKEK